jgi:hypothetical protein
MSSNFANANLQTFETCNTALLHTLSETTAFYISTLLKLAGRSRPASGLQRWTLMFSHAQDVSSISYSSNGKEQSQSGELSSKKPGPEVLSSSEDLDGPLYHCPSTKRRTDWQ